MDQPAERGVMGVVNLSVPKRMREREFAEEVQKEVSAHGVQALVEVEVKFSARNSVGDASGNSRENGEQRIVGSEYANPAR